MGFGFFTRRSHDKSVVERGEKRGRLAFRTLGSPARALSADHKARAVQTTVEAPQQRASAVRHSGPSPRRHTDGPSELLKARPCRFVATQHKLGTGAYGSVLLGSDLCSGDKVAIKFIADGRMKPASLEREIGMLRRLSGADHPALLRFYAHVPPAQARAGEIKGHGSLPLPRPMGQCHALVMEMARGGELFEYVVARDGLDEQDAGPIFGQLVDAVRTAHSLGIAHRDLKLENVLLCGKPGEPDERQIKLIDWGLAHQHAIGPGGLPVAEMLHSRCGSRSYMAPEVNDRAISGTKGYNGFSADVWSLGVCLFAIHLGFFPFEQAEPEADWRARRVVDAQRRGQSTMKTIFSFYPHKTMSLSRPLLKLLDRMLVFEPTRRATLQEVMASEWLAPRMPAYPVGMELDLACSSVSASSTSRGSQSTSHTPPMSPRALERQDSGSTAHSIGSSVGSSVVQSMARLRQLEAARQALPHAAPVPEEFASQWDDVRYAVASGTLPKEEVHRLSALIARANVDSQMNTGSKRVSLVYPPVTHDGVTHL